MARLAQPHLKRPPGRPPREGRTWVHELAYQAGADLARAIQALPPARIEVEEYPQVTPPIADLFSDAEDRLWVGLANSPPGTSSGHDGTSSGGVEPG